jgi:orotidine-5'-phosphate decarboxylase
VPPRLPANPLIVALDTDDLDAAVGLVGDLERHVGMAKVGLELFSSHGPGAVRAVADHAPVFLDVKLHDIPTTVERSARVLGRLGVSLLTVHASGGPAMIAAAATGLAAGADEVGHPAPLLVAVTVLTSLSDGDLAAAGQAVVAEQVPRLARLASSAGADGVVCAPRDLAAVRDAIGVEPVVVTPGIRPPGAVHDDHARAATPAQALADGADLLVVGRPITAAPNPVAAASAILDDVPRGRR